MRPSGRCGSLTRVGVSNCVLDHPEPTSPPSPALPAASTPLPRTLLYATVRENTATLTTPRHVSCFGATISALSPTPPHRVHIRAWYGEPLAGGPAPSASRLTAVGRLRFWGGVGGGVGRGYGGWWSTIALARARREGLAGERTAAADRLGDKLSESAKLPSTTPADHFFGSTFFGGLPVDASGR